MKSRFTTFLKTLLLVATLGLATTSTQASDTNPIVELHTNKGKIVLSLDAQKAPKTVANFLQYVESGFYDGTIFHRVINNFMIQGGGFTDTMQQKPTKAPIVNESSNRLKNDRYTIAMARTNDPNSATAQFFINVADNKFLDYQSPNPREIGYAVFGKVIEGTEVVDLIKAVQTGNRGGHSDVPVQAVIIQKAVLRK